MTATIDTSSLRFAFRDNRKMGWFEFYRQPCLVCGSTGNCMISEDGKTAVCTRVESDVVFSKRNLSYVHPLDGDKVSLKGSTKTYATRKKFDDYVLSHHFNALINDSTTAIRPEHIAHFANVRKIGAETIAIRGYSSYPEKPWETAKNVLGQLFDNPAFKDKSFKQGLPGFYLDKYNNWTMVRHQGFLIPYRDLHNQIVGFQIRNDNPPNMVAVDSRFYEGLKAVLKQPNFVQVLDDGEIIAELEMKVGQKLEFKRGDKIGYVKLKQGQRYVWLSSANKLGGTGAGGLDNPLPYHVAVPSADLQGNNELVKLHQDSEEHGVSIKSDSVWITEGALKADLAVDHIVNAYADELDVVGKVMLAVPGVNTWRSLIPALEAMEAKRVNIAFDMDAAQNEDVQKHFLEMVQYLKEKYEVYIALWSLDHAKGIDDCLALGYKASLRRVEK